MAFRNRTALFIQFRDDRIHYHPIHEIEMTSPPSWMQYHQDSENKIQEIRKMIPQLQELHKDAKTTFDDEDSEKDIKILTGKISELFSTCKRDIQKISISGVKETSDEIKLKQNVQISLATTLQNLAQTFRQTQSKHLERMNEINTTVDCFNEEQQQMLLSAEEMARSRSEDIAQIIESINQLAQIFNDMHTLILDQGTMIDRIDYNIEKVVTYTEDAKGELTKANKYHKSYRNKICILLLIVVVVALILFLAIRPKSFDGVAPGNRSISDR